MPYPGIESQFIEECPIKWYYKGYIARKIHGGMSAAPNKAIEELMGVKK